MNVPKALFSPLEYFSDRQLLITGAAASLTGLGLSFWFDVAQDGIFDLHIARVPFRTHLLFTLGNIFLVALGLFALGKGINPKTRLADMLNVSMIARIPLYLAIPFIGNRAMVSLSERLMEQAANLPQLQLDSTDITLLILLSVISILFLVSFFVLVVNGFRVAANAKKWQHYFLLILVVLLAEILSKLLYAKMIASL